MSKTKMMAVMILSGAMFAQDGKPLVLDAVNGKVFSFHIGNVQIRAKCITASSVDVSSLPCGTFFTEPGSSLARYSYGTEGGGHQVTAGLLIIVRVNGDHVVHGD